MIQKSKATEIHLEKARDLNAVMHRLDSMNLDVISVDYESKRIEISRPSDDCKVSTFPPLRGENNLTLMNIKNFIVFWTNPKGIKEVKYGNA